jgi:hypothetical protein
VNKNILKNVINIKIGMNYCLSRLNRSQSNTPSSSPIPSPESSIESPPVYSTTIAQHSSPPPIYESIYPNKIIPYKDFCRIYQLEVDYNSIEIYKTFYSLEILP